MLNSLRLDIVNAGCNQLTTGLLGKEEGRGGGGGGEQWVQTTKFATH